MCQNHGIQHNNKNVRGSNKCGLAGVGTGDYRTLPLQGAFSDIGSHFDDNGVRKRDHSCMLRVFIDCYGVGIKFEPSRTSGSKVVDSGHCSRIEINIRSVCVQIGRAYAYGLQTPAPLQEYQCKLMALPN